MYCVCKTPRAVRQMVKPSLPQLVVLGKWRGAWAQGWGLCSSLSRRLRTKARVRSRGATQTEEQESSRREGQQGQKHPWWGRDSSVPLPPGWHDWGLAMMTPPDCATDYFQKTHSLNIAVPVHMTSFSPLELVYRVKDWGEKDDNVLLSKAKAHQCDG